MRRGMPHRGHANKHDSAQNFRKNVSKTHPINIKAAPMRGGWRL